MCLTSNDKYGRHSKSHQIFIKLILTNSWIFMTQHEVKFNNKYNSNCQGPGFK